MRGQYHDKENHHPNIIRQGGKIKEVDFSAISRAYVLQGDRLKVKSIYYNDKMRQTKMNVKEAEEIPTPDIQNLSDHDIYKLEYLQKMGVINEEEQQILNNIRKHMPQRMNQQPEQISQSRYYEEEESVYPLQKKNNNTMTPPNNYYPPSNNYYQQNQPSQYHQGYYGAQNKPQWN